MKITCPYCSTSYHVPDGSIGDEGRDVRCANCGETWHVEKALPPPPDPASGSDSSQDDIDSLFNEGPSQEQSQDDIDALFDSPSDAASGGEEQSQDDIDSLFDAPQDGESQRQDDVDSLFDEDEAAVSTSTDIVSAGETDPFVITTKNEQTEAPVVDLMDAAEFEAQKTRARYAGAETMPPRRRRRVKPVKAKRAEGETAPSKREWAIGGGALGASLVLLITLLAAPTLWVGALPDLASLYRAIGMDVNVGGVDIETVHVRLVQEAGAPVIAVEAELVNPGEEPVILPSVQLSILGSNEAALHSWTIDPESVGLGPGERKLVETRVAAPSQAKYISLRVFHQ